mmetsp:Transcript_1101/g.2420  ORF Transcript_1101/g.2420 Transcript_1101/m.2420 type:complete len:251 (-) Transcript_1101:189-941(-)
MDPRAKYAFTHGLTSHMQHGTSVPSAFWHTPPVPELSTYGFGTICPLVSDTTMSVIIGSTTRSPPSLRSSTTGTSMGLFVSAVAATEMRRAHRSKKWRQRFISHPMKSAKSPKMTAPTTFPAMRLSTAANAGKATCVPAAKLSMACALRSAALTSMSPSATEAALDATRAAAAAFPNTCGSICGGSFSMSIRRLGSAGQFAGSLMKSLVNASLYLGLTFVAPCIPMETHTIKHTANTQDHMRSCAGRFAS